MVVQAAVLNWSSDPKDVVPQTVAGSVNILKAAARESSVKAVVITSSSTAAVVPVPNKKEVIDEGKWPQTRDKICVHHTDAVIRHLERCSRRGSMGTERTRGGAPIHCVRGK